MARHMEKQGEPLLMLMVVVLVLVLVVVLAVLLLSLILLVFLTSVLLLTPPLENRRRARVRRRGVPRRFPLFRKGHRGRALGGGGSWVAYLAR